MNVKFAFNIWNYELADIFFYLSDKYNKDIILQTSQSVVKKSDFKLFISHINELKNKYNNNNIIINLDHSDDMSIIKSCVNNGWDMVMFDGSLLDYKNNLKKTKQVVDIAKSNNVLVEGELGKIPGVEDNIKNNEFEFTDLDLAKEYVNNTGVDYLALSIGTKHGLYKNEEVKLNFELLKKANKVLEIPLVLHGGSGLSELNLKKCIKYGINKINISTEVKLTYFDSIREISKIKNNDYFKAKEIMYNKFEDFFVNKIKLLEELK